MSEARRQLDRFVEAFAKTAPKAVACFEDAFSDATAVMCLPEKYHKRLRSTNMQEPSTKKSAGASAWSEFSPTRPQRCA